MASENLDAKSIQVRMYLYPFLDLGRGPTTSKASRGVNDWQWDERGCLERTSLVPFLTGPAALCPQLEVLAHPWPVEVSADLGLRFLEAKSGDEWASS